MARDRFALIDPKDVDCPIAKLNTCREPDELHVNTIFNSILEHAKNGDIVEGLLNPVTVTPVGDRWRVVDGQHRFKAIQKLIKEKKVPESRKWPFNVVNGLSDIDCLEKSIVFNYTNKQMTDFEIGNSIATLSATNSSHYTQQKIGAIFSREQSWVSNHLKAFRLAKQYLLMDLYKQNKVSKTDILQIDSCKEPADREEYIKQIKENFSEENTNQGPISPKKIKERIQKNKKKGKDQETQKPEEPAEKEEPASLSGWTDNVLTREIEDREPENREQKQASSKIVELKPNNNTVSNQKSLSEINEGKKVKIHPADLIKAIYENNFDDWRNEELEQIINYMSNKNEFSLPERLNVWCTELGYFDA